MIGITAGLVDGKSESIGTKLYCAARENGLGKHLVAAGLTSHLVAFVHEKSVSFVTKYGNA